VADESGVDWIAVDWSGFLDAFFAFFSLFSPFPQPFSTFFATFSPFACSHAAMYVPGFRRRRRRTELLSYYEHTNEEADAQPPVRSTRLAPEALRAEERRLERPRRRQRRRDGDRESRSRRT